MPPQIKIVGGNFKHIKGNLTEFDYSSHETNFNSNNAYHNKLTDSYNDNSKIIGVRNPRPRRPQHEENDAMDWTPTSPDDRGERDHSGPPPPQSQFIPPPFSSAHTSINRDSFNTNSNHISDSYNDCSRTYYDSYAPTNLRGGIRPQRGSESGSVENGQTRASGQVPFQANSPQHKWTDRQYMRRAFSKVMEPTEPSLDEKDIPDENYDSDDPDSFPQSTREKDSMSTRMADLSIRDHTPSSPRDEYHPMVTTHRSPPTTSFSSYPRKLTEPQLNPMGSSNPSNANPYNNYDIHHSYRYASVAPQVKEQGVVGPHANLSASHQDGIHRNNDLNNPPPISNFGINCPPSSSGGPTYKVVNGNLTKYNTSVHQTNFDSFNMEYNTIGNSFNNNSLVGFSGNGKKGSNKTGVS